MYNPATSLLCIHLKNLKTIIHKDVCIFMLIVVLFMAAKAWTTKLSFNWWLDKKLWYIYTVENYLALRKDTFPMTWMDLENTMLSKIHQMEKVKKHVVSLNVEYKREDNTCTNKTDKTKTHRHRRQCGGYQRQRRVGGR